MELSSSLPIPKSTTKPVQAAKAVKQAKSAAQAEAADEPTVKPLQVSATVNIRRFSAQQSLMISNTIELVTRADQLIGKLDQNGDKRLSAKELQDAPHPLDQSPEDHYSEQVLQLKLMNHLSLIDSKKDGLDSADLESLRKQALNMTDTVRVLAAVPVKEPELHDNPNIDPASFHNIFSLTQAAGREYAFESRFQPARGEAQVETRSLTAEVQELSLPGSEAKIELIAPADMAQREGLPSASQVAGAIAALPPALRELLKRVEFNPIPYRFEIGSAHNPREADMSAGEGGKVTIYPHPGRENEDLYRTFVHELGHQLSFKFYGDTGTGPGWDSWNAAVKSDNLAPSRYARVNASAPGVEDFAESVSAWVLSDGRPEHEEWRALMPARFEILDRLLGGKS